MAETEQIVLTEDDPRLYERGVSVAHSSDGEGYPDCGKSVGLGDGSMLFVGERPGYEGWSLCIYTQNDGVRDIADGLPAGPFTAAADLVDWVAGALNKSTS